MSTVVSPQMALGSRSWKRRATCAKATERVGDCCSTEERKKTAARVSVTLGQLGLVIGLELTQVYWVWLYLIWARAIIGYYSPYVMHCGGNKMYQDPHELYWWPSLNVT
ncbi:uncharacterized protein [Gossypium hirsutum]|uniref:Uncharacterized protein n=1 Tax=Gossypium hirsutum TaxID=3635 RepID=A0A1U8ICE1_GOSHI|nr:uncharacterized protein LOC107892952 [Gossypium hirsutum]